MPLNAIGWATEEDEKLIQLVESHKNLYCSLDHSRKDIIVRENIWRTIAQELFKPGEARFVLVIIFVLQYINATAKIDVDQRILSYTCLALFHNNKLSIK